MEIDDKLFKLIGKRIYNTASNKYGYISEIHIMSGVGGYMVYFNGYYDSFDSESILSINDFKTGALKFVLIDMKPSFIFSEEQLDDVQSRLYAEIKEIMGEDFSDNMIIHMTDDEHDEYIHNEKEGKIRRIGSDLVNLTELSAKVFYDNFSTQRLFTKFKDGVISETEMLYGVCNCLSEELQCVKDRELELFTKHEMPRLMEETLEQYGDMLNIPPEFTETNEREE